MSNGGKEFTYFSFASFPYDYLEGGGPGTLAPQSDSFWIDPPSFYLHTLFKELLDGLLRRMSPDRGLVEAFYPVAWMEQTMGQFAIVGQEEKTLGVSIETSYRKDSYRQLLQEDGNRWATVGIGEGSKITRGFVKEIIDFGDRAYGVPIHRNFLSFRVHSEADFLDRNPIYCYAPGPNEFIGLAPGSYPAFCQVFIESYPAHLS